MKTTDIYRPRLSNNGSNKSFILPGRVGKFTPEEEALILSLSPLIRRDHSGRLVTYSNDEIYELIEGESWKKTRYELKQDQARIEQAGRDAERAKMVAEAERLDWPWVNPLAELLPDKDRKERVNKWKQVFAGLLIAPTFWPEEAEFARRNGCKTVADFFRSLSDAA